MSEAGGTVTVQQGAEESEGHPPRGIQCQCPASQSCSPSVFWELDPDPDFIRFFLLACLTLPTGAAAVERNLVDAPRPAKDDEGMW